MSLQNSALKVGALTLLVSSWLHATPWMKLTSAIAPTAGGGGLYNATLANRVVNGSTVTYQKIADIQWLCIDYYNHITTNTWIEIKLNPINSSGMPDSRFSGMNDTDKDGTKGDPGDFEYLLNGGAYGALDRYKMVAYLANEFWTEALDGSPNSATLNDIQKAIWRITTPEGYNGAPTSSGMWSWISNATTNGLSQSADFYASWKIVSEYPLNNLVGYNNFWQEGITKTPEPGFWALLGCGICGVLYRARRRRMNTAS